MPSIIFWACALAATVILRLAVGRVSTRQALEIGMDYTLGDGKSMPMLMIGRTMKASRCM